MNSATTSPALTIATYNIHDAVGSDRVFAPDRIAHLVLEGRLDADTIALQEIPEAHTNGVDVVEAFAHKHGIHSANRCADAALEDMAITETACSRALRSPKRRDWT